MKLTKTKWKKIWKEFDRRFNKREENPFCSSPSWEWQKKQIEQIISEELLLKPIKVGNT